LGLFGTAFVLILVEKSQQTAPNAPIPTLLNLAMIYSPAQKQRDRGIGYPQAVGKIPLIQRRLCLYSLEPCHCLYSLEHWSQSGTQALDRSATKPASASPGSGSLGREDIHPLGMDNLKFALG
jgi:hypothetical protein